MFATIRNLFGLIRFSHTVFALPFAFTAAALAWWEVPFRPIDAAGILLCMVFARSFAMAVNRLTDRFIDAKNPRTAGRHLPAGSVQVSSVVVFAGLCAVAFVAAAGLFLLRDPENPWPLYLSVPVLLFLAGYSWTKRFTSLAHVWLGAALALAPVAAWIAIRGMAYLAVPGLLGGAVLFWVAGFDILYACQDFTFDRAEGLHSIPARFGIAASLRIAAVCHAVMLGWLLALFFACPPLRGIYLAGLAGVAALLIYEHALVRPDDLSRVNRAFFQVNAIVSLGLFAVVIVQLLVGAADSPAAE